MFFNEFNNYFEGNKILWSLDNLEYPMNPLIVLHYLHLYFLTENWVLVLVIMMSTLALLLLSAIMISTVAKLGNHNAEKDSSINRLSESREWSANIKRSNKMEKPTFSALKSQVTDAACLKKAETYFQAITKKILLPPAYDMLYERVRQMQCYFVSTSS